MINACLSLSLSLFPSQLTPMEMDFLSAHTTQVLSAFQEVIILVGVANEGSNENLYVPPGWKGKQWQ